MRRDAESGHAVHEAGGEAAQTAIAKRGVGFERRSSVRLTPSSFSASSIAAATPRLVMASNRSLPIRNSSER